jgi:hypothetical protein
LPGDLKNSVIFKTLSAVASKALAPALTVIRSAMGPVLPYVQSVISFVPGVGTGISAALGAAQALADGRRIDEALVAAACGAIPGGPMAQMAFDSAWGLAHGRPVDSVVLRALRDRSPAGLAQRAFDTGLALATAKTAQEAGSARATPTLVGDERGSAQCLQARASRGATWRTGHCRADELRKSGHQIMRS